MPSAAPVVLAADPRRRLLGTIMAGLLVLVAACTSAATPSPATTVAPTGMPAESASPAVPTTGATGATLSVTARDFAFDMPSSAEAGLTTVTLENTGQEDHQAQIARLNDGVTPDQLAQALQNPDPSGAFALVTFAGGPTAVAPGATVSTTSNLAPGNYIFLCFIELPDGLPHVAKGMIAQLQVTGSASSADLPDAQTTVTAKDFEFDVPTSPLQAGKTTFRLHNAGPQPHEAGLVKLESGVTVDQLEQMLAAPPPTGAPGTASGPSGPGGPPPFTSAGGIAAIAPNAEANVEVDLSPGNYALVCFVPDPSSGKAHIELGMIAPLTVQ